MESKPTQRLAKQRISSWSNLSNFGYFVHLIKNFFILSSNVFLITWKGIVTISQHIILQRKKELHVRAFLVDVDSINMQNACLCLCIIDSKHQWVHTVKWIWKAWEIKTNELCQVFSPFLSSSWPSHESRWCVSLQLTVQIITKEIRWKKCR